jgi:hypothetical protein
MCLCPRSFFLWLHLAVPSVAGGFLEFPASSSYNHLVPLTLPTSCKNCPNGAPIKICVPAGKEAGLVACDLAGKWAWFP